MGSAPTRSIPRCSTWLSSSCCSVTAPKSVSDRCTWLPDAHAEGRTPISAVLSALLLNVALYALLRFKMLLAVNPSVNPSALAPGPLMVALGLTSLVFAVFMLYRRRDIKRMFAYSPIEHMGIITFAFGMGGPLANFAGLLHITMHSLTKSAIFGSLASKADPPGTCEATGRHAAHRLTLVTLLDALDDRLRAWSILCNPIPAAAIPKLVGRSLRSQTWFTEGFDTHDLKEAKALLGQLVA